MNIKKLLLVALFAPLLAAAWTPPKTVTAIVGNAPGAGNEVAFRKAADIVTRNTGINFVVENRPGNDSVIAMNMMLTKPIDGSVIALPSHMSTYVTNDIWEKKTKQFEWNSFEEVLSFGKAPLVVVAAARSTVTTPADFLKFLQTTKAPVNVAIGGGAHRMAFEYIMFKTKSDRVLIKTIKFNGPAQAVVSVASYDGKDGTEFGIMPASIALPLVQSGKIKFIGLTGQKKLAQLPTVPLLADAIAGVNVNAGWNIILPPATPPSIVNWYVAEFGRAIKSKEYIDWATDNLIIVDEKDHTPEGVRAHMLDLRQRFMPMTQYISLEGN